MGEFHLFGDILLVHRQETMCLLGFPLMRYIDINDSEEIMRAIQFTEPDVPVGLALHTPGGLVLAALQIAPALRHGHASVDGFPARARAAKEEATWPTKPQSPPGSRC